MNTELVYDFSASEVLESDSVWVTAQDDRMYKVEVLVANRQIITAQFHDKKVVFTYGYGHWRGRDYVLSIDA